MGIIFKTMIKSLIEKKARTLLVLFSIAISSALIFANESFSQTVRQRLYEADVRWSGVSDFYIESKDEVGAKEWIDTTKLSNYEGSFEYACEFIKEKTLYIPSIEEMHYFTIIGAGIDEFNRHNPVTLKEGSYGNWDSNQIVVGKTYADIYGFKVGDRIELELNSSKYEFMIAGIAESRGLFLRELADQGFILAPKETLAQIYGGGANLLFIKLIDRTQREAVKQMLDTDFAEYNVRYGINDEVIEAETQNFVMPFRISSIVVIFMSMFIIFTAFSLITLERIPLVGILRSIGATRRRINRFMFAESAVLGIFGGLIGCLLGLGVVQIIKGFYFTGEEAYLNSMVTFGTGEVLTTVIAAAVITVLSAILPILRLTKTPIKNIILNDVGKKQLKKGKAWIVGLILLAACAIGPHFLGNSFTSMIIGGVLMTGALVGLVPVVPFLTRLISKVVEKLPFLAYSVKLGVRNTRDNKSLMNNIQLFAASIAIVALMASLFATMGSDLLKSYERDMKFDIIMKLRHSDEQSLARLEGVEGVSSFAKSYLSHTSIVNHKTFLNALCGIDDADYFKYNPVGKLEANTQALANLNNGRNMITTNVLKGKLGLQLGDHLVIQFGSKEVAYTITGFVETNWGIGHVGYISAENYRADMGVTDYDQIYIMTDGDPEDVKSNIKRALTKEVMNIDTKADLMHANADKVIGVFNAISSYSYIALLIGIIGILNNLAESFLGRKRNFAMYRCVGMSKKSLSRMLVTEAVAMGVLGIFFGIGGALIMSSVIPPMVSVMWGQVTTVLAVKEMVIMGGVGITAMLLISIVPVTRSNKLSIIESIKYE